MMKRKTVDDFIKTSINIHGDKYDYSKVVYVNNSTKVCIVCPEHGEFWQKPANHISGQGCPKCGIEKRSLSRLSDRDLFVQKSFERHGNKYDYSKICYQGVDHKVCIVCPVHGEFWQTPYHHLNSKVGCPKCAGNVRLDTLEFINRAKAKHGSRYDYSKTCYVDAHTPVCIICPTHGEFHVSPANHLSGNGCPKCVGKNKTTKEFISEAKDIHGNIYDYSKVCYHGAFDKITIGCPVHGYFETDPHTHLSGSGCPKCNMSKLEKIVMRYLDKNKIRYEYQKKFDWLFVNKNGVCFLKCDFYLPTKNIVIECQGSQHFKRNEFFDIHMAFEDRIRYDKLKYELCKEHDINVLYYADKNMMAYSDVTYIYNNRLFCDIEILLKNI